jgi:hypothetical protein
MAMEVFLSIDAVFVECYFSICAWLAILLSELIKIMWPIVSYNPKGRSFEVIFTCLA